MSVAVIEILHSRRKKFVHREAHFVEKAARVFFGRSAAFFFGNTEIERGDDDLHFPH